MLTPFGLQVEYKTNPLGMDERRPRFFYRLKGDSLRQTERCIQVVAEDGETVWDSGFQTSSSTIQIEYEGLPLKPFTRYDWRVRVKDEKGALSAWTKGDFFETGFLGSPWKGEWITDGSGQKLSYVTNFRRAFTSAKKIRKARLYATALGVYRPYLNGVAVSPDLLTPGWTDYFTHVQYQAYDVTPFLRKGENVLGVELGDGWYRGVISGMWAGGKPTYGACTMFRAELHLTYADGTCGIIATDKDFQIFSAPAARCGGSYRRFSDIYMGEYFVSDRLGFSWMLPGFKGRFSDALPGKPEDPPKIVWQSGAPVRVIQELEPVSITRRGNGNWIVDFGQNLAGVEQLHLKNVLAGTCIMIRHGEMLQADGSLYTDNLRSATATTVYRAQADIAEEIYEPLFTFFGFRYLEISGWPGRLTKSQIKARVIHSDLPRTGEFSCSEPLVNQLFSNIVWGQKGNFIDVPTDCPQRDERAGWTGDTQVFCNVATYNTYAPEFYSKWIADLNDCIDSSGAYPYIAPSPYKKVDFYELHGASGWADAGLICPMVMFTKYADRRILGKYFDNMCRWLDAQVERAGGFLVKNALFKDWLNIDEPTPEELISTAYLSGMNILASKMAAFLGRHDDAAARLRFHKAAAEAFAKEFLTARGELKVKTQTAALLALAYDCIPEKYIEKTVQFLVRNIKVTKKLHLSTGFLGTPHLLHVLTEHGEADLAYDLLLQTTYPGWLYSVTQGATTMWERWNSWTKETGFGDVDMNSFNHYAYGAVGEWFYETICGIQPLTDSPDSAGFHRFRLAPVPGKRLTHASAVYDSISGRIASAWKRTDKSFVWNFEVPCNTEAEIICPFGKKLPKTAGIRPDGKGNLVAQPGTYRIVLPL